MDASEFGYDFGKGFDVDISSLRIAPYAYSRLTEKQLTSLTRHARELGRNEVPILIRSEAGSNSFEIVHGENHYRAAKEAGLHRVFCVEVEGLDTFGARLLAYRAEIHGKADPVALGELFDGMISERQDLKGVDLAKMLGTTEGTIRNKRLYSKLARLAENDKSLPPRREISKLSVREVRRLLKEDIEQEKEGEPEEMKRAKNAFAKLPSELREQFVQWAQDVQEARNKDDAGGAGEA